MQLLIEWDLTVFLKPCTTSSMVKVPEKSGYILSLFQYQSSGKKDLAIQLL